MTPPTGQPSDAVNLPQLSANYAGQWVGERIEWAVLVTWRPGYGQGVYARTFDEQEARASAKRFLKETAAEDTEVICRRVAIGEWERSS